MRIKSSAIFVFFIFTVVVTGQVFYFSLISSDTSILTVFQLRTILISSLVGVIPTYILNVVIEKISRKNYFFMILPLHFLFSLGGVLLVLYFRGNMSGLDFIRPSVIFLVLYAFIFLYIEWRNRKMIESLNERIKTMNNK